MIKIYSAKDLKQLSAKAAEADRLRAHLNVHDTLDANVQRLFIATEPDTYMRPHRHPEAHKWEFFMVLSGEIHLLIFDDSGALTQRITMAPDQIRAIELPANTWHAYVCMQPGTVALEVKEGAYTPTQAADFAEWSPVEGSTDAKTYLQWMRDAQPAS